MILKRIKQSNPELHEIRSNGSIIGHIEVNWGYCRAFLGDKQFYEVYDYKFWNSFSNPAERKLHLDKITEAIKALLAPSLNSKQLA